jgi:hypothetical protein
MITLTNFCVAMLFYPTAVKAAKPPVQNNLGCGELMDSPVAKIKLAAAKTSSSLMPCCIERNQNSNFAIFIAEKPLVLTSLALAPEYNKILQKFSTDGYTVEPWAPPEQIIIDANFIRV